MKHTGVFQTAFRRLAGLYAILAAVVTLSFTVPPLIAQQQARNRVKRVEPPLNVQQIVGPSTAALLLYDDDSAITGRFESFVDQRDDRFGRHLTTLVLEINGLMLLVTIIASYFLARRSLQPLQEVLDQQETFAAELAHELKTPLATALLELEQLKRSGKNLTAEQKTELSRITHDIKEVGNLTEQTLALMAVDYTESGPSTSTLDLKNVVAKARSTIGPAAKLKNITVAVNQLPDLKLMGNEIQLGRLFVILLDNAVKYTHEGGSVTLDGQVKGNQLEVRVTDTGVGIPSELHEKIFEKFYQGNDSANGSGLGLAIARRICETHGGSISVKSEPQRGAVFTVSLPILEVS